MQLVEIKDYLKIDDDYEDNFLIQLIEISEIYIDSMAGETYKKDKKLMKLANLLQKKIIADMYENRSTSITKDFKNDRITTSILDKLGNCTEDI